MEINIWDLLNLRLLIAAVLALPLLTMLAVLPVFHSLSKNARESLALFGLLGFIASSVLCVEIVMRIVGHLLAITFFDEDEPFRFGLLFYGAAALAIALVTWQLTASFDPSEDRRKKSSGFTSLNLRK